MNRKEQQRNSTRFNDTGTIAPIGETWPEKPPGRKGQKLTEAVQKVLSFNRTAVSIIALLLLIVGMYVYIMIQVVSTSEKLEMSSKRAIEENSQLIAQEMITAAAAGSRASENAEQLIASAPEPRITGCYWEDESLRQETGITAIKCSVELELAAPADIMIETAYHFRYARVNHFNPVAKLRTLSIEREIRRPKVTTYGFDLMGFNERAP